MFFDLQQTPEELARRRKYSRTRSTPASTRPAPKPRLKEIIRKGPFALVWINPNPPVHTDDDCEAEDGDAA